MKKINFRKYCMECGCELERGEVDTCKECQTKTAKKTITVHAKEEIVKVPFPKIAFQF